MLMSRRSKRPLKTRQKYVTTRLSAAHLMGTQSPGFPLTIRHSFKSSEDKQLCTRSRRTRGVRALITIFSWTFFPPPPFLRLVQIKYRETWCPDSAISCCPSLRQGWPLANPSPDLRALWPPLWQLGSHRWIDNKTTSLHCSMLLLQVLSMNIGQIWLIIVKVEYQEQL